MSGKSLALIGSPIVAAVETLFVLRVESFQKVCYANDFSVAVLLQHEEVFVASGVECHQIITTGAIT
jgi:hypothetical protein